MTITRRFIYLAAAGIPLLAASIFFELYGLVFLLYNAICFGLLAVDYLITPSISAFAADRDAEDKLYFQTDNLIKIGIQNHFHKPVIIDLKDEIPDRYFHLTEYARPMTVPPGEKGSFAYHVTPVKRGSFQFERVYIRYTGLLGLCKRFGVLRCPQEYKVYPNLQDISRYRLAIQKSRLLRDGGRSINMLGNASEFEGLREYVVDDDYRRINWMATARENKLIINQYEAEKNQPVMLLLDAGRPMSYSVQGRKKLDYAIHAALILSDIVNQKGDRSGLMVFDTDVKAYLPPGKGNLHRNQLMEALYHIEDTTHTPDYEGAFRDLNSRQKRRSLVFLFTDFETPEEARELIGTISMIKRRHIPVVMLMKSESVQSMADSQSDNLTNAFQKGVALEYLHERRNMIKALRAKGIFCTESSSENLSLTAVNHYLRTTGISS